MNDIAILDDPELFNRIISRREHRADILREGFNRKLKHCEDDAEAMTDYCRDMVRAKIDATAELNEAETFIRALLLVVLLLKREHSGEA